MIVLREAMPASVMRPTSVAMETLPTSSHVSTSPPMKASGMLRRICATIIVERKCE